MLAGFTLSSAIALAVFASRADAHGYLEQPKPSWVDSPNVGWITMVDNYWDIGSGGDQVGAFKTMAKEKDMSVKDVVLDMVKDKKCGNTVADGNPQPIPSDGKVKWLGNNGGGFTHTGPCEIYLDNKMVLHGDNCEDEFQGGDVDSSQTSDMPVDFSSCNGKCMLTIYWVAFQNEQWQTYVNCVPLSGGGATTGGSATQTQASEASSSETDASNKASSQETETSKASSGGEKTTEAPSTDKQSTKSSSTGVETPEAPAAQTPVTTTQSPSTETQSTEASSTGAETPAAQTPATTTQATQAPSTGEAPTPKTDTKCNAPARRLRKETTTA